MTGAVEDIGEALAPTGHVAELCTVLEGVDSNARSVDLRDAQRRVSYWSIRIPGCSAEVSQGKPVVRHARSAGLEGGTRIYSFRVESQSGRGTCDADRESSN